MLNKKENTNVKGIIIKRELAQKFEAKFLLASSFLEQMILLSIVATNYMIIKMKPKNNKLEYNIIKNLN